MKKAIKRFWGIGLIIIMLSSLFMMVASPVSAADPLRWESKTGGPSTAFNALTTSTVYGMAMSPDTKTMYAVCGTTTATVNNISQTIPSVFQSTNSGSTWTQIGARFPFDATTGAFLFTDARFIAIAPDDPNTLVVVSSNGTARGAIISVNAGSTWTDMAMTNFATGSSLMGVAISPIVTGGIRYVATWGQSAAAAPVLDYFNYGSGVGAWKNACTQFTSISGNVSLASKIVAVAFSPNFASDYVAMAVSEVPAASVNMLHALSFNSFGWDNLSTGYPVTIETANVTAPTVSSASIALGPDFMGSDESLRVAFVGLANSSTLAAVDGIWRCTNTSAPVHIFSTTGINSVAYSGTMLVGGSYASNVVYNSSDMLSSNPTFLGNRNLKGIGIADGTDKVRVMYVGGSLFGSKEGASGAISKSTDDGTTWNDFTMIHQSTTNIDDIMVSADGATWYVSVRDTATTSVFRMSPMQRVLTVGIVLSQPDLKLRGLASDPNVIYAYDYSGTTLYYSADGGVSRWQLRLNVPAAIADLAVESANVIYIGSGVNVYKSINNGFTWNTPVNTTATANIYSMLSLGTDKLVVGAQSGGVLFSKDGGTTWTRTLGVSGGGNMQVAATGLDASNFIFAAGNASNAVYRCEIGPSNPTNEFKSMNTPVASAISTYGNSGLQLTGGVLYAVSQNGTYTQLDSILTPTMNPGAIVPANAWRTAYNSASGVVSATTPALVAAQAPSALDSSTSTGKITLYAINTVGTNGVRYFDDTLALVGPTVTAPADKALVQVNSITGLPLSLVLMWNRPSLATGYEVYVSTDSAFVTIFSTVGTYDPVTFPNGYVGNDGTRAQMSLVLGTGGSSIYNPGTTYYWKVRATFPITSAWSETRSFTIQPVAAPVPSLTSPVNGSTITNQSPAFSWSPVTSTTQYDFQLSTTPTFGTTILTDQPASAGTLVPVTIKLDQGKQYFWRVRALQPVQGDWSTVANFFVAVPATTQPPVTITNVPAPTITIPAPSPAPTYTLAPAPVNQIAPTYIWAIIIIGAILVIAVIVLVVRTRRSV